MARNPCNQGQVHCVAGRILSFAKETMLANLVNLVNQDCLVNIRAGLGLSHSSTGSYTPHPNRTQVSTAATTSRVMEGPDTRYPASSEPYRLRPWLFNHRELSTP